MKYHFSILLISLFVFPLFAQYPFEFYIETDATTYEFEEKVTIFFNIQNIIEEEIELMFVNSAPFFYSLNDEQYYCPSWPVVTYVTIPADSTYTHSHIHDYTLEIGTYEVVGAFLYLGESIYSDPIYIEVVSTDADKQEVIPTQFELSNHPNPFNPSTTISFNIPEESVVKIEIFNLIGQRVKTLIDDHFLSGKHKIVWDGNDDSGRQVSSGVYFYRLEVNGKTVATRKGLLLK
jgi:hypothetical protein